jgi:hypothetical protein
MKTSVIAIVCLLGASAGLAGAQGAPDTAAAKRATKKPVTTAAQPRVLRVPGLTPTGPAQGSALSPTVKGPTVVPTIVRPSGNPAAATARRARSVKPTAAQAPPDTARKAPARRPGR